MDTLETLFTRRSMRKFSSAPVSDTDLQTILRAGMAAPCAEDRQHRRYLVITDREQLENLSELHPSATPAAQAPLAILVCSDTAEGTQTLYWPQDCAAAIENMMLAARALGLGSLWCGIHPQADKEQAFISSFGMPGMVRPVGLVIIGRPLQEFFEKDTWQPDHVFHGEWGQPFSFTS